MRPSRLHPRGFTTALTSSPVPICPACIYRRQLRPGRRGLASSAAAPSASAPRAPPPPPASGVASLPSRRLISISGVDAARFLQGIITSSIYAPVLPGTKPTEAPRESGFYTGFLNSQGRVLYDVFIYPDTLGAAASSGGDGKDAKLGNSFLIEVDAGQAQRLERHIKRFKLRSKFKARLLDTEEFSVWHAWDDAGANSNASTGGIVIPNNDDATIVLRDSRTPSMGHRLIRRGDATPPLNHLGLDRADEAAYTVRRYLQGVAEGQEEMVYEQALPLDSNMDVMGGVDFRKGCYVGQELTIRTRHRGIVRKRILPCALYAADRAPPTSLAYRPAPSPPSDGPMAGEELEQVTAEMIPGDTSVGRVGRKGRSAGKWLKGVGNIGLALCRLEIMTDVVVPGAETAPGMGSDLNTEFVLSLDETGEEAGAPPVRVKAFVPEWLRIGIAESGSGH